MRPMGKLPDLKEPKHSATAVDEASRMMPETVLSAKDSSPETLNSVRRAALGPVAGCHLTVVTINSPVSAVRYNVRHLSMLTCQFQLGIKRNLA